MLSIKCPVCKISKYNKVWLLLCSGKDTRVCKYCSAKIEWNRTSVIISGILIMLMGTLSSRIINNFMVKGIYRELVWSALFICLTFIIISLIPKLHYSKEKLND